MNAGNAMDVVVDQEGSHASVNAHQNAANTNTISINTNNNSSRMSGRLGSPDVDVQVSPVARLMDELKGEETAVRVAAMQRLYTISIALGPSRTREELLPFLEKCCMDDEDEVLSALAENIVSIGGESLGGVEYNVLLLSLLEGLVGSEEQFVREKAVQSLQSLLATFSWNQIHNSLIPAVLRLTMGDWHSKRISAVQLIAPLIARINFLYKDPLNGRAGNSSFDTVTDGKSFVSSKADSTSPDDSRLESAQDFLSSTAIPVENDNVYLQRLSGENSMAVDQEQEINKREESSSMIKTEYLNKDSTITDFLSSILIPLSKDDVALVRKEVALSLVNIAPLINGTSCIEILIPILQHLSSDYQDSVRLHIPLPLAVIMAHSQMPLKVAQEQLAPIFLSLATDQSWRIRFTVASHYAAIVQSLKLPPNSPADVRAIYSALLNDQEAEVRGSAAAQLAAVAKVLYSKLATDRNANESSVNAVDQMDISSSQNISYTMMDSLESPPGPSASSNTANAFDNDQKSTLPLNGHPDSRNDNHCPSQSLTSSISNGMFNQTFSNTKSPELEGMESLDYQSLSELEPLASDLDALVHDESFHVRAATAAQLSDLAQVLGHYAALHLILPKILLLLSDSISEVRLAVMGRLAVLVTVLGIDRLSAALLPAIAALAEDPQWRVRQTIVLYLPDLAQHLGTAYFTFRLAPMLTSALSDPVFAVRESAIEAVYRVIRHFITNSVSTADFLPVTLNSMATHRSFLRRMTALQLIARICSTIDCEEVKSLCLPILNTLSSDPVPNVRLNVAKAAEALIPVLLASDRGDLIHEGHLLTSLQQLRRDSDQDVFFSATQALNLLPS